eukprot:6264692-Karenia_brevis.AAC.1
MHPPLEVSIDSMSGEQLSSIRGVGVVPSSAFSVRGVLVPLDEKSIALASVRVPVPVSLG